MAHIGKESTLQTIGLFRPVFCYAQVLLRFQQLILQAFRTEIIEERDAQAEHQNHKQSTGRPYLISILLIERNRLVDKLHFKRQYRPVQPPFLHLPAIQYRFAADYRKMFHRILRVRIHPYRLHSHFSTHFPVVGQHPSYRPMTETHR